MPITISDVAAQAGVSKSTVSRYLNERYECMSLETRDRITAVIDATGYRPNALARGLKQKRTHTLAAIVANILNPFSTSVIRGIEDYCQQAGFNLILCNADDRPAKERQYVDILAAKQIDGLIINTTGKNNSLLASISQQMPVVLIDRKVPELQCDTVTVDCAAGVKAVIDHLIRQGHNKIAMLTLPYQAVSPRLERVHGYREALVANGIPYREDWLLETDATETAVEKTLAALFTRPDRPSALFGVNNLMTMAIVKVLKRLKIKVPQDVAVIGFDDWEWASQIEPPVTVVAQPAYDMGKKAAALLIGRLQGKNPGRKPAVVTYMPELVIRKSCGEGDC